jgi:MtN3 and saliva related transmembrane protein
MQAAVIAGRTDHGRRSTPASERCHTADNESTEECAGPDLGRAMPPDVIQLIGAIAAALTTLCWLPQVVKIVRERDTGAISFPTNLGFAIGVLCWLIYGYALSDWPLIISSLFTLALTTVILALKLRLG